MTDLANSTSTSTRARPKRRRSTTPRISQREAARLLALRDRLEQHLETMIGWLNELDGDPDLEPSLGANEHHPGQYGGGGSQTGWSMSPTEDREWECEDEGAQCDDEGDIYSDMSFDEAAGGLE